MRKKLLIIVKVLLAIVVVIFLTEDYLWYKGFAFRYLPMKYDHIRLRPSYLRHVADQCGWGFESGVRTSSEHEGAVETTWANGQRASRSNPDKSARYRVLVTGCSYTFGVGLDDSQTYCWKLNERFDDTAFDNYGVGGWGTYQSLMLMEDLLPKQKYDAVFYSAIGDHLHRNTKFTVFGNLTQDRYYGINPRVYYDSQGRLPGISTLDSAWPGEDKLRIVDFLKRAWCGYWVGELQKRYDKEIVNGLDTSLVVKKKVLYDLLCKMNGVAQKNGAKFYAFFLEDGPMYWKNGSLPQETKEYLRDISLKDSFTPPYRLDGDIYKHPNDLANTIWAKRIGDCWQAWKAGNGSSSSR